MAIRLHLFQQPVFFERFHDSLPAGRPVHATELAGGAIHLSRVINHLETGQSVTSANLKIIGIMGRGYLQGARAEFHANVGIPNDRNPPVGQGQHHLIYREILISGIIGMNGDSRVAKQGFRSGCCNQQTVRTVWKRIPDMIQKTVHILMFNFQIRQCGMAPMTPVDDIITPVNQSFMVKLNKYFSNRFGKATVHGESFALPVTGCAKPFQLIDNGASGFFPPGPYRFNKFFPAQLVTADAL